MTRPVVLHRGRIIDPSQGLDLIGDVRVDLYAAVHGSWMEDQQFVIRTAEPLPRDSEDPIVLA
jgi:hypothetical protein